VSVLDDFIDGPGALDGDGDIKLDYIDGPGALDGDLNIIGDTLAGRDPEIRYRVRPSITLALLLLALLVSR
jgi:hypothetical protein